MDGSYNSDYRADYHICAVILIVVYNRSSSKLDNTANMLHVSITKLRS